MEPYTFSGTKLTIPKDQQVFIPIYSIQRDPEIFPNPEVFDPDRFSEENIKTRHPMSHLPFGDGPRHCSGKTNFYKIIIIILIIVMLSLLSSQIRR